MEAYTLLPNVDRRIDRIPLLRQGIEPQGSAVLLDLHRAEAAVDLLRGGIVVVVGLLDVDAAVLATSLIGREVVRVADLLDGKAVGVAGLLGLRDDDITRAVAVVVAFLGDVGCAVRARLGQIENVALAALARGRGVPLGCQNRRGDQKGQRADGRDRKMLHNGSPLVGL